MTYKSLSIFVFRLNGNYWLKILFNFILQNAKNQRKLVKLVFISLSHQYWIDEKRKTRPEAAINMVK